MDPQEQTDLLVTGEELYQGEPQEEGTSWGDIIQKHGPYYSSQIEDEAKLKEISKIMKRLDNMKGSKKGKSYDLFE